MAFARINGVLLHYRLHGPEGAPVVALAHSLGTDARIWDGVIDILATRFRVLSYDERGHGLSDAPPGDYSLDDHVADLAGLVDAVVSERFALAGVSVGGLIAQGFALRHPERLSALVLCDTAPRIGSTQMWSDRIAAVRRGGLPALSEQVMALWLGARYRAENPDAVAGWRNLFERTPAEGYCSTCATLRDTDLTARVGGIVTPTLVVVGEEDGPTPVAQVRALAEAIPGARFELVAGASHIPSIDRPRELAALMTAFFKEVGHG